MSKANWLGGTKPITRTDVILSVALLTSIIAILSYPIYWEYTNNIGTFDNHLRSGIIKFDFESTVDGQRCIVSTGHGCFVVGDTFDWVKTDTPYYCTWHITQTPSIYGKTRTPVLDNVMLVD